MKATFLKGVALGTAVSLVTLAATAAFAGTGVGNVFNLGETNRVNARSQLEGATPSAVLNVTNTDKSAPGSGVSIDVPRSDPPLVVNSATKVTNLNADLLDGNDSSAFQKQVTGQCAAGSMISAVHSDGSVSCSTPAPPTTKVYAFEASMSPGDASIPHAFPPTGFSLVFTCQPQSTLGFAFISTSSSNGILATTSTVSPANTTSSQTELVHPGEGNSGASIGTQLELRAIWLDNAGVLTINYHVQDNLPGCTIFGTAEFAPPS